MKNDVFDVMFKKTMVKEGNDKISYDKEDTGNYYKGKLLGSKYGITPNALAKYRGKDVTEKDIADLTEEEAKKIAKSEYYDRVKIGSIEDPDLAATVFDHEYNAGGRKGIKILQRLAGVKQDGILGPQTLKAIKEKGITAKDYNNARRDFYKQGNPKFVKGWLNRVDAFDKPLISASQDKPVQFADAGDTMTDAGQPGVGYIRTPTAQEFAQSDDPFVRLIQQAERDTGVYRTLPYGYDEQFVDATMPNPNQPDTGLENQLLDWMMPWRR